MPISPLPPSPECLELIKSFEGFRPHPYLCPAGILTQGYGHTAAAGPPKLGGVWSPEYASSILEITLEKKYATPLFKLFTRTPTQGQFDAMVSLAYNIGVPAFSKSSVLRCFNQGDDAGACAAFALWNKANGQELPGLTRRRSLEAQIYQGTKANLPPTEAPMPQNVDPPGEEHMRLIYHLQERLKALGYHEVGCLDGKMGSRTRGALLAFKADHDLPLTKEIDDKTLRALANATPRVVASVRHQMRITDLRQQKSSTIEHTDQAKAAAIAAGSAGAGSMFLQITQGLTEAKQQLAPILDLFTQIAPWVASLAIIGFASFMWWSTHRAQRARLLATQEGRHM